jgi:hypothetical protein
MKMNELQTAILEGNFEVDGGRVLVPSQRLTIGGVFEGEIVRNGEVIDRFEDHNLVVNEGLNHLLDVVLHGSTQVTTWYLGLFEGNYTPVAAVTAATITSAATETTAYDEATRREFTEAAASSQSITNSASRATFTFNATKTLYGAFLVSASAKSATTGTLFSAARFASTKNVDSGDELLLTYTFSAASA